MQERYEIRGEIGEGGVGVVYEAWDRQLARVVAIKRLLPLEGKAAEERARNQSAVHDLLREASILSSMQHPNIVSVFDAGTDEFGAYVVMERIDGEMLRDAVQRGPLTLEDFTQVVEQSLDALIAAHHHGLLHRDIKPRNFMFRWLPSEQFQVKVLDFGLAKFSPKPSLQTEAYKDTIMGSSAYMAPEQFEHKPLDFRSDLYSLGCVYYFCLTAELPFDGDTPSDVMESHLHHRVAPLAEKRPDLSPELCAWVMKLIEREPEDRPASAKEALRSFRDWSQKERTESVATAPAPAPAAPKPQPGRQALPNARMRMLALVGAVAVVCAVAVLASQRRKEQAAEPPPPADPFVIGDLPVLLAHEVARMPTWENREVIVRGKVAKTNIDGAGINFLNFENSTFYVVCFSPTPSSFPNGQPAERLAQKSIQVSGQLTKRNGKYQIKLLSEDQVRILD